MIYYAKVVYVIHEYYEAEADSPEQAKEIIEEMSREDSLNDYIEDKCEVFLSD